MPFHYYLKRCGHQELGSVGRDGKPQRGRYLLTCMRPEVLSFFPPLSQSQLNDFAPVACIPLFLPEKTKVYCKFVYHNDRFHGSTAAHPRNEYRLYLSMELEGNQYRLKAGDIVIFRKEIQDDINSPLFMDHVPPADAEHYNYCNQLIDNSPLNGGYALFDGDLDFFESKVSPTESANVKIDPKVISQIETFDPENNPKIDSLFNQVMFRDFLLVGYQGLCAITRQVIRHDALMNIEAAHIRPRAHEGNSLPSNGLMLSRDLHWAFDKGFFSLTDECNILVHPDANSPFLEQFSGKQIFIPTEPFFRPNVENIRWHRQYLYGQFKNITGFFLQ